MTQDEEAFIGFSPLPKLAVRSGEHFSQERIDAVIEFLEKTYPAQLEKIFFRNVLDTCCNEYWDAVDAFVQFLEDEASGQVEIPQTRLGMIDLIFELNRRIRKAAKCEDLQIQGIPLDIRTMDISYPLVRKENPWSKKKYNQEEIDKYLNDIYSRNPELYFFIGEMARRDLIVEKIYRDFHEVAMKVVGHAEDNALQRGYLIRGLYNEVYRRIEIKCGLRVE